MRAVVYSRVSTDAQERAGTSLESQERASREYAEAAGWRVIESIRDTASGYSLDRPGMAHLRELLRRGEAEVVVAYAVDRLSRNQNQIGVLFDEVQQAGAKLVLVTESFEDTAVGRFILAARAFVAEVEREKIVERTTRGKTERAKAGKLPQGTGKGLYGYRYESATGRRVICPDQGIVVRRVFESFLNGASCHGLAVALNREGVPAMAGGPWHALTVRRLLQNEAYTGRTTYRRTRAESVSDPRTGRKRRRVVARDVGEWIDLGDATPALVSVETFRKAQAILADPDRRLRGQPSASYRLRGRVRCLACGTPMVGQALNGGRYRYYRCRRSYVGSYGSTCAARYVPVDLLEAAVRDELKAVLADGDRLLAEAARLNAVELDHVKLSAIDAALADAEAQQGRLARLYTSGTLPEDVLKAEGDRLRAERGRLQRERDEVLAAQGPQIDLDRLRRELPAILTWVRRFIDLADDEDLALILRALQVEVAASTTEAHISGAVPTDSPHADASSGNDLATIARTSA